MAEVKLRLNLDSESVELVVDGQVALESGSDIFKNWVAAYNEKHKVHVEPVKVEEPVAASPVNLDAPVQESVVETPTVEVNTDTEGVDSTNKE